MCDPIVINAGADAPVHIGEGRVYRESLKRAHKSGFEHFIMASAKGEVSYFEGLIAQLRSSAADQQPKPQEARP